VGGAAAGIVGLLSERVAYRPLREASSMTLILAALGLSIFMQNATMLVFGADTKGFPKLLPTGRFRVLGATVSVSQLVIAGITILLLAALFYFVNRTYLGRSLRAVAEDKDVAALMGANPNVAIALIFLIGPALGGASGVLYSMQYQRAIYSMGQVVGMKGWIVSILGGIGNLKGAVIAGILLGLIETFATGYLPVLTRGVLGTEYRDVFAFLLLIIMLFVRPEGLFGESAEAT
jgi:branched-chain amino acid transport system permease protein